LGVIGFVIFGLFGLYVFRKDKSGPPPPSSTGTSGPPPSSTGTSGPQQRQHSNKYFLQPNEFDKQDKLLCAMHAINNMMGNNQYINQTFINNFCRNYAIHITDTMIEKNRSLKINNTQVDRDKYIKHLQNQNCNEFNGFYSTELITALVKDLGMHPVIIPIISREYMNLLLDLLTTRKNLTIPFINGILLCSRKRIHWVAIRIIYENNLAIYIDSTFDESKGFSSYSTNNNNDMTKMYNKILGFIHTNDISIPLRLDGDVILCFKNEYKSQSNAIENIQNTLQYNIGQDYIRSQIL